VEKFRLAVRCARAAEKTEEKCEEAELSAFYCDWRIAVEIGVVI
jgi:hypothetical protein